MNSDSYVMPPVQNLDAEMAVLGAMLYDPDCIPRVLGVIARGRGELFNTIPNRRVFDAVVQLYEEETPIDIVTLENLLTAQAVLEEIGGREYLISLTESVPSSANCEYYARIVREKGLLRGLIQIGNRAVSDAIEPCADADAIMSDVDARLARLRGIATSVNDPVPIGQVCKDVVADLLADRTVKGLPTGVGTLDAMLGGMRPGQFIVCAARPGVGKTSFALQIANHVAMRHCPVGFFSLEMSRESIARRLLSQRLVINGRKLQGAGHLDECERHALETTDIKVPLHVADGSNLDTGTLRAQAQRMKAQHNVGLIVVDYLGRLVDPSMERHGRYEGVTRISWAMKTMARELGVPVFCLHQLNREAEKSNKRPDLHNLRESGAIEQDADVVMFLDLDDPSDPDTKIVSDETAISLLVRKNREGDIGNITMLFRRSTTTFLTASMSQAMRASV